MKILDNVDEAKEPNHELKIREDSLLNEFSQLKIIEKRDLNVLQQIHNEIKSMQATNEAYTAKMAKDYEYWRDVMLKKSEWEKNNGNQNFTSPINENNSDMSRNNYLKNISILNNLNDSHLSSDIKDTADRYNSTKNKIMAEINGKK
jgi:hypothetical protein